jgi:peptidoglycan/xylan/chitin deacetylase (PgdA/CDA1 family)
MIRRGVERLRRAARWPRSRAERKVLILLYHRVTELRSDPWLLSVTPSHFAEHLEVLRQHARPIRLQQLSQALLDGNLPDRSVVVTFDDGYADNLHNAKPLLKRYGVPATVFLTSGYIGHEREFWWDELDRVFLQPGTLPERLSLNVNGNTCRWELDEAARYSEEASRRHRHWRAQEAPTPRHSLCSSLRELLHPMTEGERRRVLDELLTWAGLETAARLSHRPLSLEEAVALAKGDLVEVGAHTVTHPALSTLPGASQRDEILQSKARLEEIVGCPVTSFAYPYGDVSAETAGIVREAGFARACSTGAGLVELSTDPFQLPRRYVQDWDGEAFSRRLSRWFDG